MAQSKKKEREKRWKARILTMEPTQRGQIKQQSKGLRGTNTKSRFYRTEKLIYRKSRKWWEQISEYIDLTFQKNLEDLIEQGTDSMDPQTTYHIKGDVRWALGPKVKHEIMRGQWGKELKDINLQELL